MTTQKLLFIVCSNVSFTLAEVVFKQKFTLSSEKWPQLLWSKYYNKDYKGAQSQILFYYYFYNYSTIANLTLNIALVRKTYILRLWYTFSFGMCKSFYSLQKHSSKKFSNRASLLKLRETQCNVCMQNFLSIEPTYHVSAQRKCVILPQYLTYSLIWTSFILRFRSQIF